MDVEQKRQLTARLTREGRWGVASGWKNDRIKHHRNAGLLRPEASDTAWREMAEKYPPLSPAEPTPDHAEMPIRSTPPVTSTLSPWDQPSGVFGGKSLNEVTAESRREWMAAPIIESEVPWPDLPEGSAFGDDEFEDRAWAAKNLLLVTRRVYGDERRIEIDWGKAVSPPPTAWGVERVREMLRDPGEFEWRLLDHADTQYPGDEGETVSESDKKSLTEDTAV